MTTLSFDKLAAALCATGFLVACSPGGAPSTMGDAGEIPDVSPTVDGDPAALGILCEAEFTVEGEVTNAAPVPIDSETGEPSITGCWPSGTWTVRVAPGANNNCDSTPVLSEYVYTANFDAESEEWNYSYPADPASNLITLSVTSGGAGTCQGGFVHYSADGKGVLNLRPSLFEDGHLEGIAEYQLFGTNQLLGED